MPDAGMKVASGHTSVTLPKVARFLSAVVLKRTDVSKVTMVVAISTSCVVFYSITNRHILLLHMYFLLLSVMSSSSMKCLIFKRIHASSTLPYTYKLISAAKMGESMC